MKKFKVKVKAVMDDGTIHYMDRTITEVQLEELKLAKRFKIVSCREVAYVH